MELLIKGLELTTTINEDWIRENCYIAGGACVSNFTRSPIHDVDIYISKQNKQEIFSYRNTATINIFQKTVICG